MSRRYASWLLLVLTGLGVTVRVQGGELVLAGAVDVLRPLDLEDLRKHKAELLAEVSEPAA